MSCAIGCRRGSDLALPWLWRRSTAVAPIRPLAWEPPYATGATLKRQKKKKSTNEPTYKIGTNSHYIANRLMVAIGEGWSGSLELADTNCYIWNG